MTTDVQKLAGNVYGEENTLEAMRNSPLPDGDTQGVYVWKMADAYATQWLRDHGYHVMDAEIEKDCIGYACRRKGSEFAVFFYAYGEKETIPFDGAYCAKLRDLKISEGKLILIVYVHIDLTTTNAGEVQYKVGSYEDADKTADSWLLDTVNGKDALVYYPSKEMAELCVRFIAAYNSLNLDVLKTVFCSDVSLHSFDSHGKMLHDAVYSCLADLHKKYGPMRPAFVRFRDALYNAVPYLENYGFFGFTVNSEYRIKSITAYGLDGTCQERIVTDREITRCEKDCVPRLSDVEYLPPCARSRFSLKLFFENGERKRYDFSGDFGSGEVVSIGQFTFTDQIFRNGRITEHLPLPSWPGYRDYPERGQGVLFINGFGVSAVELYHYSYPVDAFDFSPYTDDISLSYSSYDEDGLGVGHIDDLDPENPCYLFNRNTMQATAIPEEYQETPICVYPFCDGSTGGYSEGLVMVSELGAVDLQYHHNLRASAGIWGWLDTDLHIAIQPQYIYAMNFVRGRAIVCKGEWSVNEKQEYWCDDEQWGVIDTKNQEVVPCRFDELSAVDGTNRLYLIHEGGWDTGHYGVFDVALQTVILELDFDYDAGYMFNECFVAKGDILVFDQHIPGEGKDYVYAYDLHENRYLLYKEENRERTYNGQKRLVVNKDGEDIILF